MGNYWNIVTFLLFQLKVPTSDKPEVTVNFRKLLLNRCQKEFEKDKDDDEIFEQKQKELDAATEVTSCHICKQSTLYTVYEIVLLKLKPFYFYLRMRSVSAWRRSLRKPRTRHVDGRLETSSSSESFSSWKCWQNPSCMTALSSSWKTMMRRA